MKNTIKWLGFIALVAIIAFSFIACGPGEDEGDKDLTGTITVTPEPTVGQSVVKPSTKITATYSGPEDVTWTWERAPFGTGSYEKVPLNVNDGTKGDIEPAEEGWYRVSVKAEGYNRKNGYNSSISRITVGAYADFIGTWEIKNVTAGGSTFDETIRIVDDRFTIEDSLDPKSEWVFEIDSWGTPVDSTVLATSSGATLGFRLKGYIDEGVSQFAGDYTTMSSDSTEFNVFINTSTDPYKMRRGVGNKATATTNPVPRELVKK
jgi:hypothetical protein